jgi:hypothetical protein
MMKVYPYNHKKGQKISTDAEGVSVDRGFIAHVEFTNPAAADVDAVLAATALADGVTTVVTTGIINPDYPRVLQIQGNAAGIAGNVVIEGKNVADETITETIVANGATAVSGNKAFKTVTKITLPARNAAGNTISVGMVDKLGLPYKLATNTVLMAAFNGAKEGTAPAVAVSTSAIENNTIDLSSALDGHKVDVWLVV